MPAAVDDDLTTRFEAGFEGAIAGVEWKCDDCT